jgi:uncharacterized protein (DUF433 family)
VTRGCISDMHALVDAQENPMAPSLPDPLILVSADTLSGAPVFNGTRVLVQTLFDYLEGGQKLDEFLDDFPTVSREHAVEVLKLAARRAVKAPAG